jgi:hypothetical protein
MLVYNNRSLWRFLVLLILLPTIYAVFGWTIAYESKAWGHWLIENGQLAKFNIMLEENIAHKILYGLAILIILGITLSLTLLSRQIAGLFTLCFKSDTTAILAVLIWSLILALIICFLNYFAELLLLLNSAILGRLELQEIGYNKWQICTILMAICTISFAIGLLGFDWLHYTTFAQV